MNGMLGVGNHISHYLLPILNNKRCGMDGILGVGNNISHYLLPILNTF